MHADPVECHRRITCDTEMFSTDHRLIERTAVTRLHSGSPGIPRVNETNYEFKAGIISVRSQTESGSEGVRQRINYAPI